MITVLLAELEEKKDKWISAAIRRLGLDDEGMSEQDPENLILQLKDKQDHELKELSLELECMAKRLKELEQSILEKEQSLQALSVTLSTLQSELKSCKSELEWIEDFLFEEYEPNIQDRFAWDDKNSQVAFKDRKISRLRDSFKKEQEKMLQFYEQQIMNIWNADHTGPFTTPPVSRLSLKHGHGLDQYVNPLNFKKDYHNVLDTLKMNSRIAYEYYLNQLREDNEKRTLEMQKLLDLNEGKLRELLEVKATLTEQKILEESMKRELEDKLSRSWWEWNTLIQEQLERKEILMEEFVKTVSKLQGKLLAEETNAEERWAYHQYCQIMLMQGERIIGNDEF
ncbi:hypothetical protein [Bacillus sp. FJAT-27251]|uniref:hypothetical protein n=1 Tax=Bacillus sp. FJAT-27251 TaxID=1684142 RepID=UPI0006A7623B|nr:hypothetical protein [Bacillus sp. FJAT-27251]